ncbi:MAG: glycerol-3-phosphate 1-O-acyltransferase PlsY [Verrucomicrobium sp.]|nr:glycerol-3-phosphate 1-O-acyltransferase PlsY [Verrucomicrobium sp.]
MTPDSATSSLNGAIAISFLSGSVPYGYLIGKLKRVDLRQHGSKNIGATNVWRVLGWKWGLLAFTLDFLKGFVPVALLRHSLGTMASAPGGQWILVLAALAAVLGHVFTPWLNFRGGKGVATSAGVLAAMLPAAFNVVLGTWVLFFAATRIVSLSSIMAAVILPVATHFLYPGQKLFLIFSLAAALLTVVRHSANIRRLLRGEEKPIVPKKKKP